MAFIHLHLRSRTLPSVLLLAFVMWASSLPLFAIKTTTRKASRNSGHRPQGKVAHKASAKKAPAKATVAGKRKKRTRRAWSPWSAPTYADSTAGDSTDGEDLDIRNAAVEALGPLNGSVVVVDSANGRVLTMVNQRLALSNGYQPCSTIKVPVALAALSEGIIDSEDTKVKIGRRTRMGLTEALAKSNNPYFAVLGTQLGYERMNHYARLFGIGEKAGLDIPGEQPGYWPSAPPKVGGMGMLTSYGEEIQLTPLQLASIMAAVANGGTLYYLQYPRTQLEIDHLVPQVKRRLEIDKYIPDLLPGMAGAVQYGTARRIMAITEDPIVGKTGTCSQDRVHLGWFGSFNDFGPRRLAVAVLLTGGKPSMGPAAAGVAGSFFKKLSDQDYFARDHGLPATVAGEAQSQ